jgi:NAD(P)-dependent dehydrogenase (short-subunit alcohol dehydrogenase family)
MIYPRHEVTDAVLAERVQSRRVLVTGASHGIGRATAERLCRVGAEVIVVARSADRLGELAHHYGAVSMPCDLSNTDAVSRLTDRIVADHGGVDVVVSNAGRSIRRPVADSYERFHDYERTMALNYLGPVQLLLGLLPGMRERGSGHVVNVSTVGLLLPPAPHWGAYLSSKAAFDTWLRSAAAEMADDGVTMSAIHLGLVRTRMSAPSREFDAMPAMTAEEAAGQICAAIVRQPVRIAPWWAVALGAASHAASRPAASWARSYGRSRTEQVQA